MLLSTEIQLFPDKTFFIQLGLFLIVFICLNHFVFKPVLRIIHLRKARTEGDRKKIEELTEKAQNLMREYEEKMKTAKLEGFQIKERIRKEGEEQAHRIVQEAKQATLSQGDQIKKEIEKATNQTLQELQTQAKVLGKGIAEKILGRTLN